MGCWEGVAGRGRREVGSGFRPGVSGGPRGLFGFGGAGWGGSEASSSEDDGSAERLAGRVSWFSGAEALSSDARVCSGEGGTLESVEERGLGDRNGNVLNRCEGFWGK